jgi:hypothetical protein
VGLFCVINKGSTVFDTIVQGNDTSIINYIGFDYDASNKVTLSGSINIIDQVLKQVKPRRIGVQFKFRDGEPLLQKLNSSAGTHLIEDTTVLRTLKWTGSEMYYVTGESWANGQSWDGDYLMMGWTGRDFTLTYTTPKIIAGKYDVLLRADASNINNAFVQFYIDGVNMGGGPINLTTGAVSWDAFNPKNLGNINFIAYEQHVIQIKSLIPGIFKLDAIIFDIPK